MRWLPCHKCCFLCPPWCLQCLWNIMLRIFNSKGLGYPRVVIPKDEKNGYFVLAAIIRDVWPKRWFQEAQFQPNAVFLGSRSVNNTTKKRAFTNQTLRSNNRQLAASLNAHKLSLAKLQEKINELNGEILELRREVSYYIHCLMSKKLLLDSAPFNPNNFIIFSVSWGKKNFIRIQLFLQR